MFIILISEHCILPRWSTDTHGPLDHQAAGCRAGLGRAGTHFFVLWNWWIVGTSCCRFAQRNYNWLFLSCAEPPSKNNRLGVSNLLWKYAICTIMGPCRCLIRLCFVYPTRVYDVISSDVNKKKTCAPWQTRNSNIVYDMTFPIDPIRTITNVWSTCKLCRIRTQVYAPCLPKLRLMF